MARAPRTSIVTSLQLLKAKKEGKKALCPESDVTQ